jgi:hypothetical protein
MNVAVTPFEVLGVSQDATLEEIDAAYHTLLEKYNPDHYLDPEEKAEAIRQGLALKTAYRKVRSEYRRTAAGPEGGEGRAGADPTVPFDFLGQVPESRTWAMQRGQPFRAPPLDPEEEVVVYRPPPKPQAPLVARPANWRQWWRAVAGAAAGTIPLVLSLGVLYWVVAAAIAGGLASVSDWLILLAGFLLGSIIGLFGLLPAIRLWLLMTHLMPR